MIQSLFLFLLVTNFPWTVHSQPAYASFNQYNPPVVVNPYFQQNLNQPNQSRDSSSMIQSNVQQNEPYSTSSMSPIVSSFNHRYLVGNISQSFSFQVAPPSVKVTYLGLNGLSLYIMGVGFSNKSKFNYDEQNNRLTILSLDSTTVGHYSAVDNNWKTFTTVLTGINVSSLEIENFRVREEKDQPSSVSCSVSIIRSTFKEAETFSSSSVSASKSTGVENLPRLSLFLSTRLPSPLSPMSDERIYNDTLIGQTLIRSISMRRALTRADHNGTIQCQVESNNNVDVYLTKTEAVDIYYGPNLEAGATAMVNLKSEMLKMMSMECQIEANPTPSYVWYELAANVSSDSTLNYGQYSMSPMISGQSVFGTTRQIQRIYQHSGTYSMQCQAQSNGKTVRQDFVITVEPPISAKLPSDSTNFDQKTSKIPKIIGIVVGAIFLTLVLAITFGVVVYLKRRKTDSDTKDPIVDKSASDLSSKSSKARWGNSPIDYGKYKTDSSSTSHLVESAENGSIQVPSIGTRSSPMNSRHSSYRQTPSTLVSLSYRQASALPGFRPLTSNNLCSAEQDEVDEVSTSIVIRPSTINRSRTTTPLGSHRSLSASIQSLRSNQQPAVVLPMKKRSNDATNSNKQDQYNSSPSENPSQYDYQHHHYQNPGHFQVEQKQSVDQNSSDDNGDEQDQEQPTRSSSSNYGDPSIHYASRYKQVEPNIVKENHYAASYVSDRSTPIVNNCKEKQNDEVPPSYQQISNGSSIVNSYVYREPTEV